MERYEVNLISNGSLCKGKPKIDISSVSDHVSIFKIQLAGLLLPVGTNK